ncbi:hypothetical protein HGP17_24090 [Rhizobium sp. P38BS-XIX]|uniref:hypothetical protein n=1 Tax=Rhizobium sp. P38BS-XIX TaxID=2726740 RepID=UPI00145659B7|nr:hypothetical protein [Rhizobium sp. P38BS-XIX]NLR99915.1 hypothetical protein [Rhizobium sp. P38BS-XIX]
MTNVIKFPPQDGNVDPVKANVDSERLERICAAASLKAPFLGTDQKRVAENLHRLIEYYENRVQVRKTDVTVKAGLGDPELNSTKRLDTYTLPPGANETRRERLAKKPHRYIDISNALASLVDETKDAMLCKVFDGSSFGTERASEYNWQAQPWEKLTALLEDLVEYVIQTTDMEQYWTEVSRLPGWFDVRASSFKAGSIPIDGGFRTLIGNPIVSDEIPPIPSVLIVRSLKAPPVDGSVSVADSEWYPARFLFWRETRLAVGRIRTNIGPLLEMRTVLEASSDEHGAISFDNPFTDGSDKIEKGLIGGTLQPIRVTVDGYVEAARRQGVERSYFMWDELSAASLRAALMLGRHDVGFEWECYANRDECALHERPVSPFLYPDPALFFYSSIISGSLERDLAEACRSLVSNLDAHKQSVGEMIRQGESAARLCWSTNLKSEKSAD